MSFDSAFLESVQDLFASEQGTERMAELLYLLIRFLRPRSVVEGGAGYSSVFIAKALRDNQLAWARESAQVVGKTRRYIADIDGMQQDAARAARRMSWMLEDPVGASPGHYVDAHTPCACSIDNMSDPTSTAIRVAGKLKELGLENHLKLYDGEFWEFDLAKLPAEAKPIDLLWIDLPVGVKESLSLIDGAHWKALNPNGGLLVIHCMLTNTGGQAILREFEQIRRRRAQSFELLGLIEPHKLFQNNVLMIRKVSDASRFNVVDGALARKVEAETDRQARRLIELP